MLHHFFLNKYSHGFMVKKYLVCDEIVHREKEGQNRRKKRSTGF
jgi:hypothetical protein